MKKIQKMSVLLGFVFLCISCSKAKDDELTTENLINSREDLSSPSSKDLDGDGYINESTERNEHLIANIPKVSLQELEVSFSLTKINDEESILFNEKYNSLELKTINSIKRDSEIKVTLFEKSKNINDLKGYLSSPYSHIILNKQKILQVLKRHKFYETPFTSYLDSSGILEINGLIKQKNNTFNNDYYITDFSVFVSSKNEKESHLGLLNSGSLRNTELSTQDETQDFNDSIASISPSYLKKVLLDDKIELSLRLNNFNYIDDKEKSHDFKTLYSSIRRNTVEIAIIHDETIKFKHINNSQNLTLKELVSTGFDGSSIKTINDEITELYGINSTNGKWYILGEDKANNINYTYNNGSRVSIYYRDDNKIKDVKKTVKQKSFEAFSGDLSQYNSIEIKNDQELSILIKPTKTDLVTGHDLKAKSNKWADGKSYNNYGTILLLTSKEYLTPEYEDQLENLTLYIGSKQLKAREAIENIEVTKYGIIGTLSKSHYPLDSREFIVKFSTNNKKTTHNIGVFGNTRKGSFTRHGGDGRGFQGRSLFGTRQGMIKNYFNIDLIVSE